MTDTTSTNAVDSFDIAVIGISCRFPGAKTVDEFWKNISNGVESISFFTEDELIAKGVDPAMVDDPAYVRAGGVLEDADMFDAVFFGFFPREVEIMDPQQRLFLECCWEAWEDAGYHSDHYDGYAGVFGGTTMNTYLTSNVLGNSSIMDVVGDLQMMIGNDKDFLTTRVSHKLGMKGPSFAVQTACSTSLVAVHVACSNLLSGQCDMALAGGSSIRIPQGNGYLYQTGSTSSPDGHCRAFDAQAAGSVVGSGVGIVVLKRLADAIDDGDHIYAVIKGTAINNDGSERAAFSTPSVDGQARVVADALAVANVSVETLGYVEAHGTGTCIGDPIEITALTQAFRTSTDAKQYCALGSVKPNIGHLDAAAGVSGLIKTIMMLRHRQLPPLINFEKPNLQIDFASSPFYINTELCEWKTNGTPRRAGVTSIGLGGANAHVIVEEAPEITPSGVGRSVQLLMLSAKTEIALQKMTDNLATHLRQHPAVNLADVAYTLQVGRAEFDHRQVLLCQTVEEAVNALERSASGNMTQSNCTLKERHVIFMFPGQGTQHINMAADLYRQEPVFQDQVDQCAVLLEPHLGFDIREVLYPREDCVAKATEKLNETFIAQPSVFVIEYALAQLWMSWGIQPVAMIGHSVGELVAACLANVLSLEHALFLLTARGRLMQELPRGKMLSLQLSEQQVQTYIGDGIALAAVNGPLQCVLSGATTDIERLEKLLTKNNVAFQVLRTSHAFHSQLMDPVLAPFTEQVGKKTLKKPQIKFISSLTGEFITDDDATDPKYWARHLRETVRFYDGLGTLMGQSGGVLLEVGPGTALSDLARHNAGSSSDWRIISSMRHRSDNKSDVESLVKAVGGLWQAGVTLDWAAFCRAKRHRLSLPTYPFDRKRFWLDPQPRKSQLQTHPTQPAQATAAAQPANMQPTHISINAAEVIKAFRQILGNSQIVIPLGDVPADIQQGTQPNGLTVTNDSQSVPEPVPTLMAKSNGANTSAPVSTNMPAPVSNIEQEIATLWKDLLGIDEVGLQDNIFELGAHSLVLTQLLTRLRSVLQVQLSMQDLFDAPTLSGMVELVNKRLALSSSDSVAQILQDIEKLSPAEVERLLIENK